jgi:hypothetical protein
MTKPDRTVIWQKPDDISATQLRWRFEGRFQTIPYPQILQIMSKPRPLTVPQETVQRSQPMPLASPPPNLSECELPISTPISTVRPRTPDRRHSAPALSPSTPIQPRLASTALFSSTQRFRDKSYTAMGNEMKGYVVGPMPPQTFLDVFFPTDKLPNLGTVSSFKVGHYSTTVDAPDERYAYDPFVSQFS